MHVTPNKTKIPGVRTKYILNGNDHIKAININDCLEVIVAMRARQAGNNNIKSVVTNCPVSVAFEYGL